jgi:signal peptidase I
MQRANRRRKDLPLWQESLLFIGVVFFLAILVRTFLFQAVSIPSGSMQNTLQVGDRVLVNKVVYDFGGPQRGEVVVFRGPSSWTPESTPDNNASMFSRLGSGIGDLIGISAPGPQEFIKRVVGLPGDTVACCDDQGRVIVNGKGVDEPYVTMNAPNTPSTTASCTVRPFRPVVVQAGQMFVMGDHRLVSQDSRCQGQVPISNIIGRASAIVWPTSHWTSLGIPASFKAVPKAYSADAPVRTPIDAGAGGVALVLPLLTAFGVTARSERGRRGRRRRLRA